MKHKYYYRTKHYNYHYSDFDNLLAFFIAPIVWMSGPLQDKEGWMVQCKKHWWEHWYTCISYGCITIDGASTKEQAEQELKVLKENNVGLYDFHFNYKGPEGHREFYITEKFDKPSYNYK